MKSIIAKGNRISSRSMNSYFVKYFEDCSLVEFDVENNKIDYKGINSITKALEKNNSLVLFFLKNLIYNLD